MKSLPHFSNAITMLEKEVEISKKSLDKYKKLSEEVLRERDAVRKDLKRAECKCLLFPLFFIVGIIVS